LLGVLTLCSNDWF